MIIIPVSGTLQQPLNCIPLSDSGQPQSPVEPTNPPVGVAHSAQVPSQPSAPVAGSPVSGQVPATTFAGEVPQQQFETTRPNDECPEGTIRSGPECVQRPAQDSPALSRNTACPDEIQIKSAFFELTACNARFSNISPNGGALPLNNDGAATNNRETQQPTRSNRLQSGPPRASSSPANAGS